MSLESKLVSGIKKHASKAKPEPKEPKGGSHHRVEIEKLHNGYTVTAHTKHEPGEEYEEPMKTAHKSIHEAFRHAKSLMVPAGQNSDGGEMME